MLREIFRMAFSSLGVNKLRSFLTMSGITIGVFSVIGVMTAVSALRGSIESGLNILDVVREVRPPFSPEATVEMMATLLKAYHLRKIVGDRYAGEWPREAFKTHGITYEPSARPKSQIYSEFLPLLNSKRCSLLDNQKLMNQLIGLERRTARSGKDSIDHAPNGHDDVANAVAGVLTNINGRRYRYDSSLNWVVNEADSKEWRAGRLNRYLQSGGLLR